MRWTLFYDAIHAWQLKRATKPFSHTLGLFHGVLIQPADKLSFQLSCFAVTFSCFHSHASYNSSEVVHVRASQQNALPLPSALRMTSWHNLILVHYDFKELVRINHHEQNTQRNYFCAQTAHDMIVGYSCKYSLVVGSLYKYSNLYCIDWLLSLSCMVYTQLCDHKAHR